MKLSEVIFVNDIQKEISDLINKREEIIKPLGDMTSVSEILAYFRELRVIDEKIKKLSKLV